MNEQTLKQTEIIAIDRKRSIEDHMVENLLKAHDSMVKGDNVKGIIRLSKFILWVVKKCDINIIYEVTPEKSEQKDYEPPKYT